MDADSHTLIVEANKSQDDFAADQKKLSSTLLSEEQELLQPLPQTTPLMLPHSSTQVIAAVPLSYKLPDEPDLRSPKEKNGSPSGKSGPKTRKYYQTLEEKYKDKWKCVPRQRTNGKWDKYYYHMTEGIMCRSWKEVEQYEVTGIRPERRRKGKQKESTEEAVKEEVGNSEMENRSTVEKFLADARYNLDHKFERQQHQSQDSGKTPSAGDI